jgi:23S rRNA (guanine2445-N2)-methyltransferase / 23S rRNA (guanine2069-N7)-methyltransferase
MFIDPPSFSNSKRMDNDWDVQRDHVALLTNAKELLADEGKIYFSNNLRSFKIDTASIEALGFSVNNITSHTIDEDFKRNQKIHHCWILSV